MHFFQYPLLIKRLESTSCFAKDWHITEKKEIQKQAFSIISVVVIIMACNSG